MGKIKIYELAKELKMENKDLISMAKKLGIEVSSHMSGIDEVGVKKIRENMNKSSKENKKEVKNNEVKTTGQVIIRREVIVENDAENNKASNKSKNTREGIGFNQNRKKDYNIVYRERPSKPMTVSELFGIKPKNETKKEVKKEEVKEVVEKKVVEQPKVEESKPQKVENENKTFNNNRNDGENRSFNRRCKSAFVNC